VHYRLTLPARINVLGNPTDANEGDFATISAAIEIRAGAIVEPAEGWRLEMLERSDQPGGLMAIRQRAFRPDQIPLAYGSEFDLLTGAINGLYRHSAEFRGKIAHQGVRLAVWTDVPRQSGLGGSSMPILLALAGLRELYGLDRQVHNDYVLAELTQQIEALELGVTCGFADRYVCLFGGLAYLDYRGKLHQQGLGQEPYVTYERLDAGVQDLPLVAVSTGIVRDSGDVHGRMRPRYVEEYDGWVRDGGPMPALVQIATRLWETAWRGKIALLAHDWATFGALMNDNHRLVNEMMVTCGFSDGAGWANNLLIETALAHGALGAKLTGAGGGGSVFALVRPGGEEAVMDAWQEAAAQAGLTSACIYRPRLAWQGLVVEVER
jgi:mevalonate kinase